MEKINLNTIFKVLAITLLLALIFLMNTCKNELQRAKTIQTKEVKGKFEPVKPIQKPIIITVPGTNEIVYKESGNEKFLQSQIDQLISENKALQEFYNEASDSLKNALYQKAIEVKSFNHTFEDDKLKAISSGLVRGEIQSFKLDYTIKPQTIETQPQKEVVFRLQGGFEYGNNITLSNSIFKANLGIQNRKGNTFRASIDNLENIYLGYDFSIFKINGKKK